MHQRRACLEAIFGIECTPKCFYVQNKYFRLKFLFKPYLCFAAMHGKKDEKAKTVEQGKKKKVKQVDIIFFRKKTT